MQNIKKYFMTLALLLTAVTGAWAQSSLSVVKLEVPADWENDDSKVTAADLPGFKASTYDKAQAWTGAPTDCMALLIYAFDGDNICFVPFFYGTDGNEDKHTYTKDGIFNEKSNNVKIYYTAELTEWSLTPDETGKKWTLAEMPASNVELQVEYYAESNLFLGKEALADKANIAVKNGETAVAFDDDGKSTATVTEGNTVTAKFTGKKVLGMKVEKKATEAKTLAEATLEDYGMVVCAAGHLHDAKTAVPDGCTAVGILGKVTETGHGLILALKDATNQNCNTIDGWTSASYAGTTLKVLPDDAARGANLTSYTSLGETAVSNWAVAQQSDYEAIFTNLGSMTGDGVGKTYDGNVNAFITTGVGGTEISGNYWSATEDGVIGAWSFNSVFWSRSGKSNSYNVRPVLGF